MSCSPTDKHDSATWPDYRQDRVLPGRLHARAAPRHFPVAAGAVLDDDWNKDEPYLPNTTDDCANEFWKTIFRF